MEAWIKQKCNAQRVFYHPVWCSKRAPLLGDFPRALARLCKYYMKGREFCVDDWEIEPLGGCILVERTEVVDPWYAARIYPWSIQGKNYLSILELQELQRIIEFYVTASWTTIQGTHLYPFLADAHEQFELEPPGLEEETMIDIPSSLVGREMSAWFFAVYASCGRMGLSVDLGKEVIEFTCGVPYSKA